MRQPQSQCTIILKHLQGGNTITPLGALALCNCFRLASRINELRGDGHNIETTIVADVLTGKRYAKYSLKNQ